MPPKWQSGEGIIVVIDVGRGVRAGVETTFYEQAKQCLINILQRKIFADKCKDLVGILAFGTDGTDNHLADGDQYQHISVLRQPKLVDWDALKQAENLPRGSCSADWLDALVVGLDLLHDPDGSRFSTKKIVLMTDFSGDFSDDQTSVIINGLKKLDIDLSVIGPELEGDDDDEATTRNTDLDGLAGENGVNTGRKLPPRNWNGKPKTQVQLAAELLITRIVSEVDGIICSFDEAIPQLLFFQKKSAGSANWNALMDVGPHLRIPVTGRIKIKHATAPTWKKVYAENEAALMTTEKTFHLQDDAQTAVDEADVIDGYRYGTTLVPFSDEDAQMQYRSEAPAAALSVLGFTRSSYVPFSLLSGDQVLVVTARDGDETAAVALSAVIQGLTELDMVAVTRRIYRKNSNPVLGVLYPEINQNYECLVWVPLPFQEDVRSYAFPSLQRAADNLSDAQVKAVDDLITSMSLCPEDEDDEELDPTSVLNPQLQHFFNCLMHRAINPDDPLPAPQQHILDILSPPQSVSEMQQRLASKLSSAFPLKAIAKKTKRGRENVFASTEDGESSKKAKTYSDRAITSGDLVAALVTKITTATPAQDFRAMLMGEAPNYNHICTQLENVLFQLVDGLGGSAAGDAAILEKVIECIRAFRNEAVNIDPSPFNSFLEKLKLTVVSRSLTLLWDVIKQDSLGLITSEESLKSSVSSGEAESFLEVAPPEARPAQSPPKDEDDFEDMLDDF